jgi:hypothetical protein
VFWIASGGRHLDLYTQHKKHGKAHIYLPAPWLQRSLAMIIPSGVDMRD